MDDAVAALRLSAFFTLTTDVRPSRRCKPLIEKALPVSGMKLAFATSVVSRGTLPLGKKKAALYIGPHLGAT